MKATKKFVPPAKKPKFDLSQPTDPHPDFPEMRRCDHRAVMHHASLYGVRVKTREEVLKFHLRLKAANPDVYAPAPRVPSNYERAARISTVSRGFADVSPVELPAAAPQPVRFVKGPGVIDTVIKVLTEEATKANPMTKTRLLERLVELIPGRDRDKMAGTVKTQLTKSGLPARDVPLRTDGGGGFWIFRKN